MKTLLSLAAICVTCYFSLAFADVEDGVKYESRGTVTEFSSQYSGDHLVKKVILQLNGDKSLELQICEGQSPSDIAKIVETGKEAAMRTNMGRDKRRSVKVEWEKLAGKRCLTDLRIIQDGDLFLSID